MNKKGFNTKAVGEGELKDPKYGNVVTPIFENATYVYPNFENDHLNDPNTSDSYIYSRWGNTTVTFLEKKYAALENVRYSLSFSTGMAAITSLLLSLGKKRILSVIDLYGQTLSFLKNKAPNYGIEVDFITTDKLNSLDFKIKDFDAIYCESVTNPSIKVADIEQLSKISRENEKLLIVDATFCTPYNQRPVEMGADFVLHSGTKYLNGHSDTMSGFLGSDHELSSAFDMRKNLGGNLDAFQAYLIARGMKTLGLRMERHNKNGMEIAKFLEQHKNVIKVNYPGLESNGYHSIGKRNLKGFGGMLSFRVKGGMEGARRFMKSLKIISPAPSLGGVESLATLPVDTSHSSTDENARKLMDVHPDLVRLSVGIEDAEDLIEDIDNALSKI
ncbi:PLP-dependent transferase [Caldiplasma sukawensis]